IYKQRRVCGDRPSANYQRILWIRHEVAKDAVPRCIGEDERNTKRVRDRLGVVNVLALPASKKESSIFLYRAASIDAILMSAQQRPFDALGVVEKLVGVESFVSEELKDIGVNLVGAWASCDSHLRA